MSHADDDSQGSSPTRFLGIGLGDWLTFCCTVAGGVVAAGAIGSRLLDFSTVEMPAVSSATWFNGTFIGAAVGAVIGVGVCIADVIHLRRK